MSYKLPSIKNPNEDALSVALFGAWLKRGDGSSALSPSETLKAIMGTVADVSLENGTSGKVSFLEAILLRYALAAMQGNLTAADRLLALQDQAFAPKQGEAAPVSPHGAPASLTFAPAFNMILERAGVRQMIDATPVG